MENLNAEYIKVALKCHSDPKNKCEICPYNKKCCSMALSNDALALINSQEQRIAELTEQLEAMRGAAEAWKEHSKTLEGENEKLKNWVDNCFDTENALNEKVKELTEENERLKSRRKAQTYMAYPDGRIVMIPTVESVRADTVRKMQERLKDALNDMARYDFHGNNNEYFIIGKSFIDQIAKEMLEGNANEK